MLLNMSSSTSMLLAMVSFASLVSSHLVLTYPGWRGDNLLSNGSIEESSGLGVGPNNSYPFGMQWIYPCGGSPMSHNRTKWPIGGGAVAFQPGWFAGHSNALLYINMGEGNNPRNYSLPLMPVLAISGPNNVAYPGDEICFPQLPLPNNYVANVGDNATIQVIMLAQHGASLYSCVDITFADPKDVAPVNASNCQNSSEITFNLLFTTPNLQSGAQSGLKPALYTSIPLIVALIWGLLL